MGNSFLVYLKALPLDLYCLKDTSMTFSSLLTTPRSVTMPMILPSMYMPPWSLYHNRKNKNGFSKKFLCFDEKCHLMFFNVLISNVCWSLFMAFFFFRKKYCLWMSRFFKDQRKKKVSEIFWLDWKRNFESTIINGLIFHGEAIIFSIRGFK